jgi:RND family efflux transporter MFP subunit
MTYRTLIRFLAATTAVFASPALSQEYDCVISPALTVEVASPVGGLVSEVLIARGDLVRKGDVIARLDSRVEQTTLDLMRERAGSDAEIEAQQARVDLAQSQLERYRTLVERNVSSTGQLEESEAAMKVASRELAIARMRKRIAGLESKRAEELLEQRTIFSPIDGVIVERMLFVGEFADQDTAVARITQLDPLHVDSFLPVSVYPQLELGITATIRPNAPIGGVHTGKISVIDRVFDAASGTFGVRVDIENDDLKIPAGHRCRISFGSGG